MEGATHTQSAQAESVSDTDPNIAQVSAQEAAQASTKTGGGEPPAPAQPDPGLACLAMLAQYFERPADLAQLHHDHAPDGTRVDEAHLLRAAKDLGFKAKAQDLKLERLDKAPLPVIGQWKDEEIEVTEEVPPEPACSINLGQLDGMGGPAPDTLPDPEPETITKTVIEPGGYFVLAKAGQDEDGNTKVLVQDPAMAHEANGIAELGLEDFAARFSGRIVCLASRAELAAKQRQFDLSWFIPAVVRYRKLFGEVLLASFFIQVFALISPLFFQVVIDKVLVHRGLSSLDVLVFALVVVAVFEVLFGTLRTYLFSHTTNRVDVQLGSQLYKHLMQLPIAYFAARRVGETVARVRELENVRNFLTGSALTLVLDLAFTVVFFSVMFAYAPVLTWIVVASLPFYLGISLAITPTLRRRVEEMFQRGAENTAFLTESVTGVETVKAMAVEPQMHRRWEERLAEYVKASFKAAMLGNFASNGVQLVQKITMGFTLYFGAKLVIDGDLTVGQLVAFNMLSGHVSGPILRLAQLWQDFQQMRISVERLGDILNTRTEVAGGQTDLPPVEGQIKFEGVTFRYTPQTPEVLKNVTLDVPAGQSVGIVGPSGSGKSTLTKLVQRMYVPETGKVLVDGMDLALASPAWLRRQIGVVLQENYLFNRTVWENIALSQPAMPRERIIEAAKQAGAHDFIQELPEAYDTVIGERGGTLSGGQRQRIAIARALVTDPKILIFDEATSALDYESEEIIQQNMKDICKNRTVLIIAHRLSTVRGCDRIITIEAGEIVEDGNHDALMKTEGRYARLWRQQMAGIGIDVQAAPTSSPVPPTPPVTAPVAAPATAPVTAPPSKPTGPHMVVNNARPQPAPQHPVHTPPRPLHRAPTPQNGTAPPQEPSSPTKPAPQQQMRVTSIRRHDAPAQPETSAQPERPVPAPQARQAKETTAQAAKPEPSKPAPQKRTARKKTAANKTTAKKSAPQKPAAKRATSKPAVKKTAPKMSPAKKPAAKKAPPKKAAAKKTATRKPAAKKTAAKKAAPKRASKSTTPRKTGA